MRDPRSSSEIPCLKALEHRRSEITRRLLETIDLGVTNCNEHRRFVVWGRELPFRRAKVDRVNYYQAKPLTPPRELNWPEEMKALGQRPSAFIGSGGAIRRLGDIVDWIEKTLPAPPSRRGR